MYKYEILMNRMMINGMLSTSVCVERVIREFNAKDGHFSLRYVCLAFCIYFLMWAAQQAMHEVRLFLISTAERWRLFAVNYN